MLPFWPPQTIMLEPVHTAEWLVRMLGTFVPMEVVVQVLPTGSYWPPVLRYVTPSTPPQTIIFEPVQTAVWSARATGNPGGMAVAVQELEAGSYWPPVLSSDVPS